MKTAAFLISFFLSCGILHAKTFVLVPGDKPKLSMKEALGILEKHAKSVTGREFIPREVVVMGDGTPGGGAWNIRQAEKDGKVYQFVVYFPEDECLVLDDSSMNVLGAFRRDGTPIDLEKSNPHEEDPFADGQPVAPQDPKKEVDPKVRAETLDVANQWLTAEMLEAFGEKPLGKSEGKGAPRRIFVNTSQTSPVLFKWMNPRSSAGYLEVKRIGKAEEGWKVISTKQVGMTDSQQAMLSHLLRDADIMTLPEKDWFRDDKPLDGTCWIYDFAPEDGGAVFTRRAGAGPQNEEAYAGVDGGTRRLARENSLATVTMMVWTMAEMGELR